MTTPDASDPSRRRRAAAIAGHTGDVALARAAVDDPDAGVRATALRALARLGALQPGEWRAAAGDADPGVRRAAAQLAGTDPAATPGTDAVLLALLADPDDRVVEMSAWACGERPEAAGTVAALAGVAGHHGDALCREAAVAALGAIGAPEGLAAILAALDDKATVRRRAVIALAPFEGPEVDEALRRHLHDRDRQVRQAAEDLLGR